jgi:hypothetical protein
MYDIKINNNKIYYNMVVCSSSNHDDDEQGGSTTSSIEGGNFIKMFYMCAFGIHIQNDFNRPFAICHVKICTGRNLQSTTS